MRKHTKIKAHHDHAIKFTALGTMEGDEIQMIRRTMWPVTIMSPVYNVLEICHKVAPTSLENGASSLFRHIAEWAEAGELLGRTHIEVVASMEEDMLPQHGGEMRYIGICYGVPLLL